MTPASEHTNLLERRVNDNATPSPGSAAVHRTSFLAGLMGVLVGAALVSFSSPNPQTSTSTSTSSDYEYASALPLLGKKHHHAHRLKEVVDEGNWIEGYGISAGVLIDTPPTKTLHASGQTAFNGTDIVGDDMAGQLAAAIANVDQTLEQAGMNKCDIVKIIVFVTSADEVVAEWEQYETWLAGCPVAPANTLVAIASLFRPDALVEIDVTAIN